MTASVLWFTGLSGAGKSTVSALVAERLTSAGCVVRTFDGDDVRARAHAHLGFTPNDIRENNRLIAELCAEALETCDVILVPVIAPIEAARQLARARLGAAFVEVYVRAGLAAVSRRDPKGLYEAVRDGRRGPLIGMDGGVPYEPPPRPEVVLDTEALDAPACATQLIAYLFETGRIARVAAPETRTS